MAKPTLATRNTRAVIANLRQYGVDAPARALAVVENSANRLFQAVERDAPVKSGFTRGHLRLEFTPGRFGYSLGFHAADYAAANLVFYILYVIFGTRFMPANDFLFSNAALERVRSRRELAAALRKQ